MDRAVDFGDLAAQGGTSQRLGVSEPNVLELLRGTFFEGKQVRDGHGFTVRCTQQILGVEFVFGKVAFEFEGAEIHKTFSATETQSFYFLSVSETLWLIYFKTFFMSR